MLWCSEKKSGSEVIHGLWPERRRLNTLLFSFLLSLKQTTRNFYSSFYLADKTTSRRYFYIVNIIFFKGLSPDLILTDLFWTSHKIKNSFLWVLRLRWGKLFLNHEKVKVPCSSFKWTLSDCRQTTCRLSLWPSLSSLSTEDEQVSAVWGTRRTSFCSNLKSPWFGVRQTDWQTDWPMDSSSVTYVPASSTRLSLLIGGLLCSSPSPALKHHRGLNDPACKKYCEEEEES